MSSTQTIDYTLVPYQGAPIKKSFEYPGPYNKGCEFIKNNVDFSEIQQIIFHEPHYRKHFAEEADTTAHE